MAPLLRPLGEILRTQAAMMRVLHHLANYHSYWVQLRVYHRFLAQGNYKFPSHVVYLLLTMIPLLACYNR